MEPSSQLAPVEPGAAAAERERESTPAAPEPRAPAKPRAVPAKRQDATAAPRPALRPASLLPEQWIAGFFAGLAMAVADFAVCVADASAPRVSPVELTTALLHLVALYLPLGVGAGTLAALLVWLARVTPTFQPIRQRLSQPRSWARPDPRAFVGVLSSLAALGVLLLLTHEAHVRIVARAHRAELAAWAVAAVAAGGAVAVLALRALVAAILRPIAARIGPLASPAVLFSGLIFAASLTAWRLLRDQSEILAAYSLVDVLWAPLAALVYVVCAALVRRGLRARGLRVWVMSAISIALAITAWAGSGVAYGRSNRVRSVVEQRSVLGQHVVRRYAALTDMDKDGHSWAFGGRDCNDFDPRVHPGAPDPRGDGIDADCFAGDGSPDVADLGDGRYGRRPAALPLRPNIVVLTIDALRPDHLGVAGYSRPITPSLDAFARTAVRFETAISPAPRSLRSLPSMLSGHYPSQIAFGPEYLWPSLLPQNTMLPEVLGRHGYRSEVVMGTDYFHRVDGFFQGFDDVHEILVYKPPREQAMDEGLRRLERLSRSGQPWLLWVHLFHTHMPYLVPPYGSRYGETALGYYDTEVALVDEQAGRLFDALERLGLRESTAVIVASDHGEAFEEHGVLGHCTTLYEEELRSVLMVRVPGVEPRVVPSPVGLLDVAPTVLNLTGIPVPEPMPARSLLPLMTGERPAQADRLIFSELIPDGLFPYDMKSVRRGHQKLIWWVQDGTFQLFDLERDPLERDDLSDERRDEALEMLGLVQAWVAQTNLPENITGDFVQQNRLTARPQRMSHPLDLRVPGMFTILGFDLPRTSFRPGETIPLTFYYRADETTDADVFFRVTIEGPAGYRVPPHFHAMHYPLHSRYHTNQWRAGEILRDPTPIVIPRDIDVPANLHISLALQVRDGGLLNMEQAGQSVATLHLADFDIAPAAAVPVVPAVPPAP